MTPSATSVVRAILLPLALVTLTPGPAAAVQLFIVAGQSNAAGQGAASDIPLGERAEQPVVPYYRYDSNGSTGTVWNRRIPLSGTFGPEFASARVLSGALGGDIAIVKVAVGGTTLAAAPGADWHPESRGELYDRLVAGVGAARADLGSRGIAAELAAVFWMQGESDGKSGNLGGGSSPLPQPATANSYQSNLTLFIQSLRRDLDDPGLPFFLGEIKIGDDPAIVTDPDSPYNTPFGEWDYTPVIQSAQAAVAKSEADVHLVPTAEFSQLADRLHFDTAGQVALGEAFARAYLAAVPEPSSAAVAIAGGALIALSRRRSGD